MAEMKLPITVKLPAKDVVRALLQKCLQEVDAFDLPESEVAPAAACADALPVIGAEWQGGIYAGLTLHDNRPMALVLLPDDVEDVTWAGAGNWAGERLGVLPSRIDALVLFQNLRSEFKEAAYWTADTYADAASYAWYQSFYYGGQGWGLKDASCAPGPSADCPLSNSPI